MESQVVKPERVRARMLTLCMIVVGLAFALPGVARSAWDEEDTARLTQWLAGGKSFEERGSYPNIGRQFVEFDVGYAYYQIDFRAQLCFVRGYKSRAVSPVPCEAIKRGYPLFASMLTWVK